MEQGQDSAASSRLMDPGALEAGAAGDERSERLPERGASPRRSKRSTRTHPHSHPHQQGDDSRGSSQKSTTGSASHGRSGSTKRSSTRKSQKKKGQQRSHQHHEIEYSNDSWFSRLFDSVLAKMGYQGQDGRATFEAKALLVATAVTLLGMLLQVVAVSTTQWLVLPFPGDLQSVVDQKTNTTRRWVEGYTGLWKLCRVEEIGKQGEQEKERRKYITLFPLLENSLSF